MHEIPPNTKSDVIGLLPTMALNTYSGDVPISPYMIPSVISSPAADTLLIACLLKVMKRLGKSNKVKAVAYSSNKDF